MDWHKTPKFLKLQQQWYNKLKKKGFVDIEHDEDHLKLSSERFVVRNSGAYANPTLTSAKFEYYNNCRKFMSTYLFKNKREKEIFEMHTEGISIRDIATKTRLSRRKVHETIKRLVKEMGK